MKKEKIRIKTIIVIATMIMYAIEYKQQIKCREVSYGKTKDGFK